MKINAEGGTSNPVCGGWEPDEIPSPLIAICGVIDGTNNQA